MRITSSHARSVTAILGFCGVALGAFGAHLLKRTFAARPESLLTWQTATLYLFVHVGIMLILSLAEPFRRAAWICFCVGIFLFSGSLYLLALSGARWLGAITPLGGLCFLAGWAWLAFDRRTVRPAA